MTEEDTTRYTAPPDAPKEPRAYTASAISYYVTTWIPDLSDRYTVEEVTEILKSALLEIEDEETGIDATI
jgi:hypothetical protein